MDAQAKRIRKGALAALAAVSVGACADDVGTPLSPDGAPSFTVVGPPALPFSQPVPFPAELDNRTCLVGIFPGPAGLPLVHRWNVRVGGPEPQRVTLRADAFSVNVNDRGTLRVTLSDLSGGPLAGVEVLYTGTPSNTGDLTATLDPGVYGLSLEAIPTQERPPAQSGQHYTLGASKGVALGWTGPLHYNEPGGPVGHLWSVNAGAGENVKIVLSVDAETTGGVPHQARSVTYEVRHADNSPGPVVPTTASITPGLPVSVAFTSAAAGAYILRVAADGHYSKVKKSGDDPGFYGVRCNPQPPRPPVIKRVQIDIKPASDPNSINLRRRGLVAVAVLTRTPDQATPGFPAVDATALDPRLLRMMDRADFVSGIHPQGAIPVRGAVEDVDGDGDLDLVVHFDTQDLDDEGFQGGRFDPSTIAARLYGPVPPSPGDPVTVRVFGDDAVRIVGH